MGVLIHLPVPASALCARAMHRSQMNTPGPAMRAFTCFCSARRTSKMGALPRWRGVSASDGLPRPLPQSDARVDDSGQGPLIYQSDIIFTYGRVTDTAG